MEQLVVCRASAPSVDLAVQQGLDVLGCSRAEVDIDIIQTPSRGFLGIFGVRPAEVRLRLVDPAYIARRIAQHLLALAELPGEVRVIPCGSKVLLDIDTSESRLVIGRHGQTLDAFNTLVCSLTDRLVGSRVPLIVDSNGYRQHRLQSLQRLARKLASQVRRSGREEQINPLPPEDRRVVHQALVGEEGVVARTIGKGFERKMIVHPDRG